MDRPSTSKPRGICKYYKEPRGCFNGKKCKFLHGDPEADKSTVHGRLTPYDQAKTCRFYAKGYCKRAEKCWFLHTLDRAREEEVQEIDPVDEQCSICFEKPALYGLLAGCGHVFCITCIKEWRDPGAKSAEMVESGTHKKCPMCRTSSSYITPSSIFYKHEDSRKEDAISRYKQSMAKTSCRYFVESKAKDRGRPFCPFGKDCFYQHLNDDGTPYVFQDGVEVSMSRFHRRNNNASSVLDSINFFADIFETVRREEDGHNYEWINRLLDEPHRGQLQNTFQAIRDSLRHIDRALDETEARAQRNGEQDTIVINDAILPGIEDWNLGEHPARASDENENGISAAAMELVIQTSDEANDSDPVPPLEDQQESDDAWSTTDDEEDHSGSQIDLGPLADLLRPIFTLSALARQRTEEEDDEPPPPLEAVTDDEEEEEPSSRPPLPPQRGRVDEDDDDDGPLPLEAVTDTEDDPEDGCEPTHSPRPPFVTDGRGRVIGAGDGDNERASSRRHTDNAHDAGDATRTFLSRIMEAFF